MERVAQFAASFCQLYFVVFLLGSCLMHVRACSRFRSVVLEGETKARTRAVQGLRRESHRRVCEHVRKSRVLTFAPTTSIVPWFNVPRIRKIRFLQVPLILPFFFTCMLKLVNVIQLLHVDRIALR
ncbi:hypothetical protein PUN28_012501 [Cardiocondyla obscurior]|uniref:Secreted protein n=1 Tax=Cardiocondyla obscurior TaxID=286306 RepID=A0AAW2FFN9_9HYME